jgi:hypothetical protein
VLPLPVAGRRAAAFPCYILIALLFATADLHAQTISGNTIDHDTGLRVGHVRVSLISANDRVVTSTVADAGGFFALSGKPGSYRLRAERIGYATQLTDTLTLRKDENVTVVVKLVAMGIPLPPLEVVARGGPERGQQGFARRMALGKGVFFTRDSILSREPIVVTDAFYSIPGVNVSFTGHITSMTGGKCFKIVIDNNLVPTTAVNQLLHVDWIKGIEIYRSMAELPRELRTAGRMAELFPVISDQVTWFKQKGEPCGLIWVWTENGW